LNAWGRLADLARDLERLAPGQVERDVPLAPLSRWRVGGAAAILVEPDNQAAAAALFAKVVASGVPYFIMGDASNVLFDTDGFDGVVIRIGRRLSDLQISGSTVVAQAGLWVPLLARETARAGLSGLEHIVGIPGTLGGLVLMNGGSNRRGIGDSVRRVHYADASGKLATLERADCQFSYRRSALQDRPWLVLGAELTLESDSVSAVRRRMIDVLVSRRSKFPKNLPNCGSTFLSDPALYETVGPPGRAIEQAGLKGVRRGGAQISPLHANFLVNTGTATSDDILWLIALIRQRVLERTGHAMDCEVRHVAPNGVVRPAHEPALERFGAVRLEAAHA
jgi:UDP-N-acetylmuramate dehydrogenase